MSADDGYDHRMRQRICASLLILAGVLMDYSTSNVARSAITGSASVESGTEAITFAVDVVFSLK